MKRRRLSNFLTAVSLVLCVATAVMWVRSYFHDETVMHEHQDEWFIRSRCGGFCVTRKTDMYNGDGWWWDEHDRNPSWSTPSTFCQHYSCGFGYTIGEGLNAPAGRLDEVALPYWLVCAAFLAAPLIRLRQLVRHRRRVARGSCTHCGYDLRATPERCPECGATVPTGAAPAEAAPSPRFALTPTRRLPGDV